MKRNRLYTLVESALLLALSVVFSYVILWRMPFDGAVTLVSMLPVCLISIRHGLPWGFGAAFCFSWFQILQGGVFSFGLTPEMLICSLFLDYVLAFSVLGIAGIFRKKGAAGCVLGIALACVLRFFVHFLSGVILWANYAEFIAFGQSWLDRPVLYSICYNGAFMLPETLLTVLVAVILFRVPTTKKLLLK